MAKRRSGRRSSSAGLPGGANPMAMLQKMQKDMAEAQASLEQETLEVTVGGGAVKIVISGHQRIQAVEINPDIIDMDDEEWLNDLQDLLAAAVNQAIEQSQAMAAERMEAITGGLNNIPGLGGLLG